MRLFIAEKPSLAKAIANSLGGGKSGNGQIACSNGDVVTWCFGHMLEMAPPDVYLPDDVPKTAKGKKHWRAEDLPIVPTKWKLKPRPDAAKQLKVIADLMKSAQSIVNAGDPDREGTLLVDEILDFYNYRGPVNRLWASSIDDVSMKKALNNLKPNAETRPMGEAAFARGCADWLIGMNLTRAFTLANRRSGGQSLLSVGRVQTPTLRIVVERDLAIANFKPKPFFKPYALVTPGDDGNDTYKATWVPSNAQSGLDEEGRLVDETEAKALVNDNVSGVIVERTVTPKAQRPPTCYSLSDMQFSASKLFGFDADKTLSICQALYETHKMTTYPRVDTGFLPEAQFDEAPSVLRSIVEAAPAYAELIRKTDCKIKSKSWDDKKVTAHHGIIPTLSTNAEIGDLSQDEQAIYDLIVRRFIAQFYPPYRYEQTIILHDFSGQRFKASGRTVIQQGWKEVVQFEADALEKKNEDQGRILPVVEDGQQVNGQIDYDKAKTTPPKPFNEGSLIRAMEQMHKHIDDADMRKMLKESDGIGTSATRSGIISELKRKEFLITSKKNIVSTPLGQGLIKTLPEEVTSPLLTAQAEEKLKLIEAGKLDKYAFIAEQAAFVSERVTLAKNLNVSIAGDDAKAEAVKSVEYTCPKCHKHTLIGPKARKTKGYYWMCKGVFDDTCKTFFEDKKGVPVLEPSKKRSSATKTVKKFAKR